MSKKRLTILGSTGSIGVQTLQVVDDLIGEFEVVGLSTNQRFDLLADQVAQFSPEAICVADEDHSPAATHLGEKKEMSVYHGEEGLVELVTKHDADIVVVATVGFVGVLPTLEAIKLGRTIALANKEVLVAAGDLVMTSAREHNAPIVPIDSEHSAIFQCLRGEEKKTVRKLGLTASGGPFRQTPLNKLEQISSREALRHPTWNMGPKITIDSATMMNKGLEVIECWHLFGVNLENIDVIVHPQSVIHSFVEFNDGSVIAQLGLPDMRTPIQLALTNPDRMANSLPSLDLPSVGALTFENPDMDRFPCLRLAFEAARRGGTTPAAMNAANEIAVYAFLDGEIGFMDIPRSVERVMAEHDFSKFPDLKTILAVDKTARKNCAELCQSITPPKVS